MKSKGFTLMELLTTLAVMAIIGSIAIPSFASLVQRQRLDSARQQLMGALMLTRQQAVAQGRSIVLSRSGDSWSNGWAMIVDDNNNGRQDAGETILRSFPALPADLRLAGNQPVASYVRYMPDGQARLTSGAFQAGTLTLCHANTAIAGVQLILSIGGRVRQDAAGTACQQ